MWPADDPRLREVTHRYIAASLGVADRVLGLYARAQGLPAVTFPVSPLPHLTLTVNKYPTWTYPDSDNDEDKLLLEHADGSAVRGRRALARARASAGMGSPYAGPIRSGPVGVTSVIYVEDVDGAGVIVDRIANAVLAASGSPVSLEGLAQGVPTLRGSSLRGLRMNSKQAHPTASGSRS